MGLLSFGMLLLGSYSYTSSAQVPALLLVIFVVVVVVVLVFPRAPLFSVLFWA